jgi:hypothetical protein
MTEISAYSCDFCGKIYRLKKSAKSHEKRCYRNPEMKACAACAKNPGCKLQADGLRTNCPEWVWDLTEVD